MMLTLIPFFDRNMSVSAYSLFTRKNNFLMNPSLLGSRQFDGAAYVDGLELIQELGTTTLSGGKPIFVYLYFQQSGVRVQKYKPCTDSPD